ncbi:uncharacterized protein LOC131233068 [Magnolia sinica]|uniref:uncharacterized protein LOC131233068 n=1 Tax=Magnolia sinica TaxID=86752 RepID=UPI00265955E6|nr:uncharacterized protein LOC131233068 [Magnolia sinica]
MASFMGRGDPLNGSVYVCNLPPGTAESMLADFFGTIGLLKAHFLKKAQGLCLLSPKGSLMGRMTSLRRSFILGVCFKKHGQQNHQSTVCLLSEMSEASNRVEQTSGDTPDTCFLV